MYLALACIASRDFAVAAAFKDSVGRRRDVLFADDYDIDEDPETFRQNVKETLALGGFSADFIDQLNWTNLLDKDVWDALKTINDKLLIMRAEYTGTDCPCITSLVGYARSQEELLATIQRRLPDEERNAST